MRPVVCPYRFTDRPRQVIEFLELLGLRTVLRQQDFAVLAGRSGRVAVHPRATQNRAHAHPITLVLGVPDVSAAVEELTEAGLDAIWWDEAFGRQASVSGPAGVVTLYEEAEDTYGYDVVAPAGAAESGVDVLAAVYAADLYAAEVFFGHLGFAVTPGALPDWRPMHAGEGSGIVGLMPILSGAPGRPADDETYAQVGIETTEPLELLAERLANAGHPVAVINDSGPPHLVVNDPDGIAFEVYPARIDT